MARYSCTCTDPWRPPAPSPRRHFFSLFLLPRQAPAQQMAHAMEPQAEHRKQQRMFRLPLGDWHVVGMGQVFPVVTTGGPDNGDGDELRRTEWYLTQPVSMATEKCTLLAIEKCTLWGSRRGGSGATGAAAPDGVRTPVMTLFSRCRRAPRRQRGRPLGGWLWRAPCGVASGSCCPGC